jgi:tetratricopeptide (TPR) repeat protein
MLAPRCCCPDGSRSFTRAALIVTLLCGSAVPGAAQTVPAATPTTAPALSGAARWADSVRVVAEQAHLRGDTVALAQAWRLSQRALMAFPDDPLLLHYQGYVRYRQAQRIADFDAALPLFEEAVALLERSAATRPLPETHALIASATGSMIGTSMVRGIRLGMRASAAEDRAEALGASNPRVLLLRAVSAWHKPSAFGGGEDKARELLQQALRGFERDAPARPLPAWGHAEAYAWHGQMELKAGRRDSARAAYDRALALVPGYAWVQYALKPSLERTK